MEARYRAYDKSLCIMLKQSEIRLGGNSGSNFGSIGLDDLFNNPNWVFMKAINKTDSLGNRIFTKDIIRVTYSKPYYGKYFQMDDSTIDYDFILVVGSGKDGIVRFKTKDNKDINFPKTAYIEILGNTIQNPELINPDKK
jgi:hypothetical protein